jgi:hypothetical protein
MLRPFSFPIGAEGCGFRGPGDIGLTVELLLVQRIYAYKICYVNYTRGITVEKSVLSTSPLPNRLTELRLQSGSENPL